MKKVKNTSRGFSLVEFSDRNGESCSLQKSSIAFEDCVWLGVNDAKPQILASDTPQGGDGWLDYDIPEEVEFTTRMHLTRKTVARLLPNLIKFVLLGRI